MTKATQTVDRMITDEKLPLAMRRALLAQVVTDESKEGERILARILAGPNGRDAHAEKTEQLGEMITALEQGPMRVGTYLSQVDARCFHGEHVPRVEILLPDGQAVYAVVPKPEAIGTLRCGDTVYLDAQAKAVLGRQTTLARIGEQARLVRQIDAWTVEVELDHHGRCCYRASQPLLDDLAAGVVRPGSQVVVCAQRLFAFGSVPPAHDNDHFRFLDRRPPPDVVIERDIAEPPAYLGVLLTHLRREMLTPALAREFGLSRLNTVFLTGVSGTGKTLSIEGFVRSTYELIAEVTGLALDEVPPRVLRLRSSEILSKWYGEAESNVDKFFDEVEALSEQRVRGRDGREHEAPVVVIAEEIDGLTRERSNGDVTDGRVQTTILQRLDATARSLRDRLVVVICTSNVPSLLDPAFVRRAGGRIETFGRLRRRSFVAVLRKHLRGLPFVPARGDAREEAIAALAAWLFGPNADRPVVEVVYAGSTHAHPQHRRDLLTGALVERAVQQAAARACGLREQGHQPGGLSTALLADALIEQIGAVVEQLTEHNVHHYLTVPRGSRVATLRAIHDPSPSPFDLERSA